MPRWLKVHNKYLTSEWHLPVRCVGWDFACSIAWPCPAAVYGLLPDKKVAATYLPRFAFKLGMV